MQSVEEKDQGKLQKRLNQLYRDRKKIIATMKVAINKRRLIKEDHKHHSETKLQKKQSSAAFKSQENLVSNGEHHRHLNTEQEDIKKVVSVHQNNRERNKRLLRGIQLHLKKAESKLKQEAEKTKEKLSVQEKIMKKQREQLSQLQQQKLRQLEKQLQGLTKKKQQSSEQILQIQNSLLKQKFIAYVSDLNSYLSTETKPSISWKPFKFNAATNQLHRAQVQKRNKQKDKIVESIVEYHQKFEYSKHTRQNQKEYYSNVLDQYFSNKSHFLSTKTLPQLIWMPSSQGIAKCQNLFAETKNSMKELCEKAKQQNYRHYTTIVHKQPSIQEEIDEAESQSER